MEFNFKCPVCDKSYISKNALTIHTQSEHTKEYKNNDTNLFMCYICGNRYKTKSYLNNSHMKIHNHCENRPDSKCETCGKVYTDKYWSNIYNDINYELSQKLADIFNNTIDDTVKDKICNPCYDKQKKISFFVDSKNKKNKDNECDICGLCFMTNLDTKNHRANIHFIGKIETFKFAK